MDDCRPVGSVNTEDVPAAQAALDTALGISACVAGGSRLSPKQLVSPPAR